MTVDRDVMKVMLARRAAGHLVRSGAVYRRIDQLMLAALGTGEDLGHYAAAVRLSRTHPHQLQ